MLRSLEHHDEFEVPWDRSIARTRGPADAVVPGAMVAQVLGVHADVTPEELRNLEFRESFRGYHRTDVDAFCERAAETIERLQRQIRALEDRLRAEPEPINARRARARFPEDATLRRTPEIVREIDVIQRTLSLAQSAADEAVAEAQSRAVAMTSEAEVKAHTLVTEAEVTARRITETERRRLEAEVSALHVKRDSLTVDVEELERFTTAYRDRLRHAVQAELAHLDASEVSKVETPPRPLGVLVTDTSRNHHGSEAAL